MPLEYWVGPTECPRQCVMVGPSLLEPGGQKPSLLAKYDCIWVTLGVRRDRCSA